MSGTFHDPSEYVRGLQQILISDKKRIGFLFGAGTSMVRKNDHSQFVPSTALMTTQIVEELTNKDLRKEAQLYNAVFDEIKAELTAEKFNVESILSNLEQKQLVIAKGKLNGLDKTALEALILAFKAKIKDKVSVHKSVKVETRAHLIQSDFADWIGHANRKYPVEIFTTNYDYLFEVGLEHNNVPYYCGFSGSYQPFFSPETVEDMSFLPHQVKLWKIHGSLGWKHEKESGRVVKSNPSDEDILIYPSILKYNDSQKQPYTSLMDRLGSFLRQDDSILFTCGYSFGDEHINEKIISALKTNTTSHVIALIYDKYQNEKGETKFSLNEDSQLARLAKSNGKISAYGFRNAVIGRKYGQWKLRKEPAADTTPVVNLYFDEDAPKSDSQDVGKVGDDQNLWNGDGEFFLPDFARFVRFLNSMVIQNEISSWSKL